ncbi:polyprenyl diphosphate synthase [Lyticum sinuosum]|uniref:Isoprenyl transferase n=1 Tax=Lyticum sinuosum TaxID=1332059 RepID=A0AAE4VMD9_9RICK|nr:polyprenyl diphosphate synthase [Lyticum sinuosum]MDZ5761518.1 Ditrans,polycis-undecaprenyl-diphosphate synthase ((2E,6E)-farnesyl-diphosphate specific) [Lyticum sinuosum]
MNDLKHVAIIMDGNLRWAKKNNFSIKNAYENGANTAKKIILYAKKVQIQYITLFAFSTENWKRDNKIIEILIDIFFSSFEEYIKNINSSFNEIKINFIGNRKDFPQKLQDQMKYIESIYIPMPKVHVKIAINYGGKEEIEQASLELLNYYLNDKNDKKDNILLKKIDNYKKDNKNYNKFFSLKLSDIISSDQWPEPDLLIRSGGEKRLSNFMLWHIAYTELYFCDILWPDFDEIEFDKAIAEYKKRIRKYGG